MRFRRKCAEQVTFVPYSIGCAERRQQIVLFALALATVSKASVSLSIDLPQEAPRALCGFGRNF
jgi:hypothetical protein